MASPVHLGSRTSGVDGASEGGRVDTIELPGVLVLYGVSLADRLRGAGYGGELTIRPEKVQGIWSLEVLYGGGDPPSLPATWHGHRVVGTRREEPGPRRG